MGFFSHRSKIQWRASLKAELLLLQGEKDQLQIRSGVYHPYSWIPMTVFLIFPLPTLHFHFVWNVLLLLYTCSFSYFLCSKTNSTCSEIWKLFQWPVGCCFIPLNTAIILSFYSQSFCYQCLFVALVLQVLVNVFGFSHIVKYHL